MFFQCLVLKIVPLVLGNRYRCKPEKIGLIHTDKEQSHLSKKAIYFKFLMRLRSLYRQAAWRGSASCEQVNLWVTEMINWPSALWVLANSNGSLWAIFRHFLYQKNNLWEYQAVYSFGLWYPQSGSMNSCHCSVEWTQVEWEFLLRCKD